MEFVYVVPRALLFGDHYPQGLVPFDGERRLAFVRAVHEHGFFVERERAERTPEWKQVIPYTVVTRGGRVLCLRRTRAGGEGRLHDKLSIGVGGHVNPEDAEVVTPAGPSAAATGDIELRRGRLLDRASARELGEELVLEGDFRIEPVGLINDDSNSVGAVHVGLVQILSTDDGVGIREREVLEGEFVTPGALRARRRDGADFETWSAALVDRLDELLSHAPLPALTHS